MVDVEDDLRRLTINNESTVASVLARRNQSVTEPERARELSLARLAAVIAVGGSSPAFSQAIGDAERHGATPDEILDVMCAIASVIGTARVADAAPLVAQSMGIDLQFSFEHLAPSAPPDRL